MPCTKPASKYGYPVVDGIYATHSDARALQRWLKITMHMLAACLLCEDNPLHMFLVRGALAFGPVFEGALVNNDYTGNAGGTHTNYTIANNRNHWEHILVGLPLVHVYEEESKAAPFGIWVHESARTYPAPGQRMRCTHWNWWLFEPDATDMELAEALHQKMVWYLRGADTTRAMFSILPIESRLISKWFRSTLTRRRDQSRLSER